MNMRTKGNGWEYVMTGSEEGWRGQQEFQFLTCFFLNFDEFIPFHRIVPLLRQMIHRKVSMGLLSFHSSFQKMEPATA